MGRFAETYRKHFGATESAPQLYLGFVLFFAGAAAALFGVFAASNGSFLFQDLARAREFGVVFAAIGLATFLFGLQLTLPTRRAIQVVSGLAVLLTVYAVVRFVSLYPQGWNQPSGPGQEAAVVSFYSAGLVVLVTTTAMALVVNFVARHVLLPGHELDDVFADPDRPVTMEEVLRDIEKEVSRQNLTWGGVGGDRLPAQVVKIMADFGPEYQVSDSTGARTVVHEADDHSEAGYRELMRLRGRDVKEEDQDDTASAVEALMALRRARQEEMEASWWYRFKRWLVSLFTGGRKRSHMVTVGTKPDRKNPNPEERGKRNAGPAVHQEAELAGRAR